MKKSVKIIIALILAASLVWGGSFAASAGIRDDITDAKNKAGYCVASGMTSSLNKLLDGILRVVAVLLPDSVKVGKAEDFEPSEELTGTADFLSEPAEGAMWSLGYAQSSILPDDFGTGTYYKGGYALDKKMTKCLDDLKVRVIVLDDGSGRGSAAFAAVDCIGLANHDVELIRDALSDFAAENNIVSINVSSTHIHSGIDTQGVYTEVFKSGFNNLFMSYFKSDKLIDAISPDFLAKIINETKECVEEAYASMEPGILTYAKKDISGYVRDRTAPYIIDTGLTRLEFSPNNKSHPATVIASFGCHPEAVGFISDDASSDFVWYTEKVLNDAGKNFIYLQGKLGTYTEEHYLASDGITKDRIESAIRYGEEMGYILLGMTCTEEECKNTIADPEREAAAADSDIYTPWYQDWEPVELEYVEPILNVRTRQFLVKVDNPIYKALGKISLADNDFYKDGCFNYYASTEVGYMELGDSLKFVFCPGETYAELQLGGENMEGMPFGSLEEELGTDRIVVFDLMNDAAGYIMPDDYYTYFNVNYYDDDGIAFEDSWGMTSIGPGAASGIYGEFYDLYRSVR